MRLLTSLLERLFARGKMFCNLAASALQWCCRVLCIWQRIRRRKQDGWGSIRKVHGFEHKWLSKLVISQYLGSLLRCQNCGLWRNLNSTRPFILLRITGPGVCHGQKIPIRDSGSRSIIVHLVSQSVAS